MGPSTPRAHPARRPTWPLAAPLVALCAACSGNIGGEGVAGPTLSLGGSAEAAESPQPGVDSLAGSGDFARGNFDAAKCLDRSLHPGAMPGLVRLTHRQYDHIVLDLLGVEAHAERDFVGDQSFYGFDNNADNLAVPENQVLRYRNKAEEVAEQVNGDLEAVARIVPCVETARDEACRDAWIETLLARLLRRPLEAAEIDRYTTLFDTAVDLYDDGDAFSRGLRLTLEAVLQSPSFLYRAELRDDPLDGRVIPLTSHEVAARLALVLWESVPDDALWQRALDDDLTTAGAVEEETLRMLDDPRAARMFDDFHGQWLGVQALHFSKDPATFPEHDEAAFGAAARQGLLAFARHVALESEGSVADLYDSPTAFADDRLASVYPEAAGFSELQAIDTDPAVRSGLLTQAGFLAGHADALDSSPIHRGAFIQKRALCINLGPLPADVGDLPPREGDIVTTRDQVESKTAPEGCAFCHEHINPAGFAFEAFDTLGREREYDNGAPVDTAATVELDGTRHRFDGAIEFNELLAGSDTARRCYATEMFRFAFGRAEADDDVCLLHVADAHSVESSGSIRDLIVGFTTSRGFRFRAQEDGQP